MFLNGCPGFILQYKSETLILSQHLIHYILCDPECSFNKSRSYAERNEVHEFKYMLPCSFSKNYLQRKKKKKRSLDISNLVKSQTIHEQRQEHLMVQMNNEHLEICH